MSAANTAAKWTVMTYADEDLTETTKTFQQYRTRFMTPEEIREALPEYPALTLAVWVYACNGATLSCKNELPFWEPQARWEMQ